jgi:hypothetical protein
VTVETSKSNNAPPGSVFAVRGAALGEIMHKGDKITLVVAARPS